MSRFYRSVNGLLISRLEERWVKGWEIIYLQSFPRLSFSSRRSSGINHSSAP
jgi:hypothetical protein